MDLKTRQAYPLEIKVEMSKNRIREWYNHWEGQVYVAFSGGKDSTVLLHLVRSIYPDVPALFVDTGLEYPEVMEFVKTMHDIEIVKPALPFNKVVEKYGYPVVSKQVARYVRDLQTDGNNEVTKHLRLTGLKKDGTYSKVGALSKKWLFLKDAPFKLSEQCCDIMKKKPYLQYEIGLAAVSPHEEVILVVVKTTSENISLYAKYQHAGLCREIKEHCSGRWNPKDRCWIYPASPTTAAKIMEVFESAVVTDGGFETLLRQAVKTGDAAATKTTEDLQQPPIRKRDSWLHQLQAYWFAQDLPGTMFYMRMGTGKTKVAVDTVVNTAYELRNGRITPTGAKRFLVACPAKVLKVWPRQFIEHGGVEMRVIVLHQKWGSGRKAKELAKWLKTAEPLVVVVNYDSIWRGDLAKTVQTVDWDVIISDESHRIKSHDSKVSKFFMTMYTKSRKRLCLTGTPMPKGLEDAFGQYRFLDPGVFGKFITGFRKKFMVFNRYIPQKCEGYQNETEFYEKFWNIAYFASEDVLDLPGRKPSILLTELCPKAAKVYREMDQEAMVELEKGTVVTENVMSKIIKLRQISSGFMLDEDKNVIRLGTERPDLFRDFLEDFPEDEPLVVFYNFIAELEDLSGVCDKQKVSYRTSTDKEGLDEWKEGDAQVYLCQIQSGSEGEDFTRACNVYFYSYPNRYFTYDQALKRADRPGQTRPVTNYHGIVENTYDEKTLLGFAKGMDLVDYLIHNKKAADAESMTLEAALESLCAPKKHAEGE